jgi:PhnB protein
MSNLDANPIPKGYEGITPHLFVNNAADAIEFYKKAFGAQEEYRHTLSDGKSIVHAVIKIRDQNVMIADYLPDMCGDSVSSPSSLGRTTVLLLSTWRMRTSSLIWPNLRELSSICP